MEITFSDEKIENYFKNQELMIRKIGSELAKKVMLRYYQMLAAETFISYLNYGLGKPHSLKKDRYGDYAVNLTANIRLIFKPVSDDLSAESLNVCEKVIIKGVEDYHGGKRRIYLP